MANRWQRVTFEGAHECGFVAETLSQALDSAPQHVRHKLRVIIDASQDPGYAILLIHDIHNCCNNASAVLQLPIALFIFTVLSLQIMISTCTAFILTNSAISPSLLLWGSAEQSYKGEAWQAPHVTRCFFFCFAGLSVFAGTLPALLAFRFSEAIMDLS